MNVFCSFRSLFVFFVLLILSLPVKGQIGSSIFNLDKEATAIYDKVFASPYSKEAYNTGDSLCIAGRKEGDVGKETAGLSLMIYPSFASGNMDKADSIATRAIELLKPCDEYRKAFYSISRLLSQIKTLNTDYQGTVNVAKDMLTIALAENDPDGILSGYECMGLSFILRDNPRLAMRYLLEAVEVGERNGLDKSLAATYLHLASCYEAMRDGANCRKYIDKALFISKKYGAEANVLQIQQYELVFSSLPISKQELINRIDESIKSGILETVVASEFKYAIYARYYSFKQLKNTALAYADSIESIGNRLQVQEDVYAHFGDWENAFKCRVHAYQVHDSLQAIIQSEDFAAMDASIDNAELRAEAAELKERNRLQILVSVAIIALIAIAAIIFNDIARRRRLQKQKEILQREVDIKTAELKNKNGELQEQKEEILAQNDKLEQKNYVISKINSELTDSINYAQRIQTSILPDLNAIAGDSIKGAFVIYHPYNIVSGDFYWAKRHDDKIVFVCADCTGHGVPGALMSMIGSTLLNDICSVPVLPSAGDILAELDKQLKLIIGQRATLSIQDGMDVALVIYDTTKRSMTYATARRPIFVSHMGSVQELKGTKRSIGDKDEKSQLIQFETNELALTAGDTIYLFSDGIVDQFGGQQQYGQNGKRLKTSGLKKILEGISVMTAKDQCSEIELFLKKWQGTCAQVDDICMIGIKI
ncbi:MAG: SpoIIE family protein phosphatase [Bacteroidales bacterium]|nr:SpoIIE family protein phosphatase [Bacteroidales bacterium]